MAARSYFPQPLYLLDTDISEGDGCVVPKAAWNRILQDLETETILVRVVSHADDKTWILHVHSYHTLDNNVIFLPQRCYNELKHQPSDVVVEVLEEEEMPPLATKIVLQPVDDSTEGIDVASAVSEYLGSWHVLSAGTVLHVPIEQLGGFLVDIVVQTVEPETADGFVLLRGEVPLELAEPLIRPEEPPSVTVPKLQQSVPTRETKETEDDYWNPLPSTTPGNPIISTSKGYVPFGGVGRRLCDP